MSEQGVLIFLFVFYGICTLRYVHIVFKEFREEYGDGKDNKRGTEND